MFTKLTSKYRFAYDCFVSGTLFAAGDGIMQGIEKYQDKDKKLSYDWARTLRMAAFGTFIFGPAGNVWYKFLQDRITHPNPTRRAFTKMLLDEVIFAPADITTFFITMTLLKGNSFESGVEKVKRDFWTTYKADLMLWPAVQFLNFKYVPMIHRMLFINVVNIAWNTYLSSMGEKE